MVLTIFVLGPIATTLSVGSYLKAGGTWDYFVGNLLLLRTRYYLPGVFDGKAINGPLWSLYLEVRLYLFFGALLWIFRGRRREWPTMAIAAIAIAGMVKSRWVFVFGENGNHIVCSGLFLLGALCALWSDKVVVSGVWLAVMFVAANEYVNTAAFLPLFFFFSSYFVLYFGFSKRLSRIRLPGDYSYGLYIYGWPVQQMLALVSGVERSGFAGRRPGAGGDVLACSGKAHAGAQEGGRPGDPETVAAYSYRGGLCGGDCGHALFLASDRAVGPDHGVWPVGNIRR
jgi:peptidoglycan/LPS O-acetylase OafA/YrhL